jgi:peroxiredoxin
MKSRQASTLVVGVIIGFLVGMLFVFGVARFTGPPKIGDLIQEGAGLANFEKDTPAPNFELTSLSGETVQLSDHRGQIVLINFWTTWCGPCEVEMPTFQSRYEQNNADLVILALNPQDSREDMLAYAAELGLTFPILMDSENSTYRTYQVPGFPTSYLVDRDGILRVQHVGLMSAEQLDHYLEDLGVAQ